MDRRYEDARGTLKAEIVRRVAAGARLKDVCAEAGAPSEATVGRWRAADPGFAAEMARALAVGAFRRDQPDAARMRAFLERAGAGETVAAILRDPAMPSRRQYRLWLRDSEFAERLGVIVDRRAAERGRGLRARFRPFDRALADRIIVRMHKGERLKPLLDGDPSLPSLRTVMRWRRENREFDAAVRLIARAWARKRARARLDTPELRAAIVARIRMGASLNSLAGRPGMPSRRTLYKWVNTRPDFARAIRRACEDREDWYQDQLLELAERAVPGTVGATRRAMGPIQRQLVRLRNRPGKRWRD